MPPRCSQDGCGIVCGIVCGTESVPVAVLVAKSDRHNVQPCFPKRLLCARFNRDTGHASRLARRRTTPGFAAARGEFGILAPRSHNKTKICTGYSTYGAPSEWGRALRTTLYEL